MLYLVSLPDFDFDEKAQRQAIADVKGAAVFGDVRVKRRAEKTLRDIGDFAARYFPAFRPVVEYQRNKLSEGGSYAEIVLREFGDNYMTKGIALAKSYQRGEGDV